MTVNRKTIVKPSQIVHQAKTSLQKSTTLGEAAKPLDTSSMRRVVSKKLAVGKLVTAKRLN